MIRTKRFFILLGLMAFCFSALTPAGAVNRYRAAYEDGWNWYLHRRAQGAPANELVDILHTLKKKYGHTYFNLERVDNALAELSGEPIPTPSYDYSASQPAEEIMSDTDPVLPFEPSVEPKAKKKWSRDEDDDMASLVEPFVPTPAAAAVSAVPPVAAPAAAPAQSADPFERYMAAQRAKAGMIDKAQAAAAAASASAASAAPATPAASSDAMPAENVSPIVQDRINELSSPDDMVKVKAIQVLGNMHNSAAIGPLIKVLGGESTFVSMAASGALAKIGEPAVQPLVNALQDSNPNVRIGACVALGDMKGPAIAPALQKATLDVDSRVRRAASTALGKVKPGK